MTRFMARTIWSTLRIRLVPARGVRIETHTASSGAGTDSLMVAGGTQRGVFETSGEVIGAATRPNSLVWGRSAGTGQRWVRQA